MRHTLSRFSLLHTLAALLAASLFTSCVGIARGNRGGGSKITPTITWPQPAPITNPTPLSATQLDATGSVAGTFVYSPPSGTVLASGTLTLSATFTPADTAHYTNATASVSITVNPATTNSPDAYLYITSSPSNGNVEVHGFSAAAGGKLTPVTGSPFSTGIRFYAANGKYLFGTDGVSIYSFVVASDGAFEPAASINAQQFNSKNMNGGSCGGPATLFLDRNGATLYDLDMYSDCANNAYQSFSVDDSTGALSYLAVTAASSPIFEVPLSFLGNNEYAYGSSCYHFYPDIFGFARNSDGTLTALGVNPVVGPPMPAAAPGQVYCPYLSAADSANHVVIPVQPLDGNTAQPVGPYQLAIYTADNSGSLTTTSTYSNMPTTSVTSATNATLTSVSMSPSGQLLAVAGTGGLEIFHFNGANPITAYTGPLTTGQVDQMSWDNHGHLYAISQSAGKVFVFTITPTSYSQVSGSPYAIVSPQNLVVMPQ